MRGVIVAAVMTAEGAAYRRARNILDAEGAPFYER